MIAQDPGGRTRRVWAGTGPPTIGATLTGSHHQLAPPVVPPPTGIAAPVVGTPKWCPYKLQGLDAIQMSKPHDVQTVRRET